VVSPCGQGGRSVSLLSIARKVVIALACTVVSLRCAPNAIAQDLLAQIAQDTRPIQIGQFSEPVELGSFVDFVARALEINIVLSNVDLSGRTVEFKASMTVEYRELIPLLDTLLAQQNFALGQTEEGWLMVSSSAQLLPEFEGDLATTRIFPTPLAKPSSVLSAVNAMLGGQSGSSNNMLTAVDELGVIISTAAPRINRSIERAIERILLEHGQQHAIPLYLKHVAASEARERLLQLVGQSTTVGAPRGQGGAPATQSVIAVQSFSNLSDRLVADRSSNALLFRGTQGEAIELRELVAIVDQPSRIVIRRYNAGAMSPVIATYGQRQGLGPVVRAGGNNANSQQFFGSGFVVEESEVGAFTYYGTASQHNRVEDLVREFADQVRNEQMVVEFYKLQNADADEAAQLISQLLDLESAQDQTAQSPFLQPSLESSRNISRISDFGAAPAQTQPMVQGGGAADSSGLTASSGPAGADAQGDGDLGLTPTEGMAIIADPERNQLMVRAPVRQQKEIERIVHEIDTRRPQIYLEVQIVTVNASNSFQLTVETALTNPGTTNNSRVPVFTNFGLLPNPNDVNSVRIPFADGFTSAIIDDDWVPLVVNALQTEGNGKVLSTPRMLVNDNETATINSTTNESFAQTTQTVGSPTQTSLGGQISAGTTLTVTPRISEGGFVTLELDIELSSFGERPNPDLPPNTRSDSVQTIVTAPADSTVVVGGLTFQSENKSESKIPLLGDIPIIGNLFKSQTKDVSDRTLYIFITPRILRDPTFADLRLLSRGPADYMEIDLGETPELEPALMSIIKQRTEITRARDAIESPQQESGAM
jgi:type II secretory pathway component GspD/PulD (secretin)